MYAQEVLLELLDYNPLSGSLTWKKRSVKWFKDNARWTAQNVCDSWNTRFAGTPALASLDPSGYLRGSIFGKLLAAHNVIWVMVYGYEANEVDHENGRRNENFLDNLREVTRKINCQNQEIPKNNTSGVVGVYFDKRRGVWRAQIKIDYKHKGLGSFSDFNEAVAARLTAERLYGFHPNHGRQKL